MVSEKGDRLGSGACLTHEIRRELMNAITIYDELPPQHSLFKLNNTN